MTGMDFGARRTEQQTVNSVCDSVIRNYGQFVRESGGSEAAVLAATHMRANLEFLATADAAYIDLSAGKKLSKVIGLVDNLLSTPNLHPALAEAAINFQRSKAPSNFLDLARKAVESLKLDSSDSYPNSIFEPLVKILLHDSIIGGQGNNAAPIFLLFMLRNTEILERQPQPSDAAFQRREALAKGLFEAIEKVQSFYAAETNAVADRLKILFGSATRPAAQLTNLLSSEAIDSEARAKDTVKRAKQAFDLINWETLDCAEKPAVVKKMREGLVKALELLPDDDINDPRFRGRPVETSESTLAVRTLCKLAVKALTDDTAWQADQNSEPAQCIANICKVPGRFNIQSATWLFGREVAALVEIDSAKALAALQFAFKKTKVDSKATLDIQDAIVSHLNIQAVAAASNDELKVSTALINLAAVAVDSLASMAMVQTSEALNINKTRILGAFQAADFIDSEQVSAANRDKTKNLLSGLLMQPGVIFDIGGLKVIFSSIFEKAKGQKAQKRAIEFIEAASSIAQSKPDLKAEILGDIRKIKAAIREMSFEAADKQAITKACNIAIRALSPRWFRW